MILESTFTPIFLVLELFLPKRALLGVKTIGVRAGGVRGAAEIFEFFSGKTLMIRAKVIGRKHSKKLSKADLKAAFSDVCLVKTELR